ncbi:DUF222 domain-containing protein [Sinomonas atrocyanea]
MAAQRLGTSRRSFDAATSAARARSRTAGHHCRRHRGRCRGRSRRGGRAAGGRAPRAHGPAPPPRRRPPLPRRDRGGYRGRGRAGPDRPSGATRPRGRLTRRRTPPDARLARAGGRRLVGRSLPPPRRRLSCRVRGRGRPEPLSTHGKGHGHRGSRTLPGRLAPLVDAMHAGLLPERRARTVLDAATPVPPERLAAFVAEAVDVAVPTGPDGSLDVDRLQSPGALGRQLRRVAERHAAEPLALRKAKAREHRRVDIEPAGDAMCWLTAYLPLEDAAAIDTRLESMARSLQSASEGRTLPQLRADVFADLLTAALTDDGRPAAGPRAQIIATIPLGTLEGSGSAPGEILGYGPLDPDAARLLASQAATWTRLWVDPGTGAPLALGRTRYRPSAAMRRQLGARDVVCRFPGCDRPSTATEADHTTAWASGGETSTGNLALLCREHHRLKSEGHWRARQIGGPQAGPAAPSHGLPTSPAQRSAPPPGTIEWTSPAGRRYITYPESDPPPPF